MFDAIVNNAAMGFDLGEKVPDPKWTKALLYSNVVGNLYLTFHRNHSNDQPSFTKPQVKWSNCQRIIEIGSSEFPSTRSY